MSVVMAYMAMTEDETEFELKCADLGRNEKLMPLNSDQASWIIFLPMKDSSLTGQLDYFPADERQLFN